MWEVEAGEGKWVSLPEESCHLIEAAKADNRRALLIKDEGDNPVRAFIDDFQECIEPVGGKRGFRNIRHRSFPPILLPSQVSVPPKEIKKDTRGKTRKLTITEAYSRARMRMMHSNEHNLSATNLVSDAKKMKVKKKKKRDETHTAGRPGVVTARNIATAKSEFEIQEENDNFAMSLLETDLPKKPSLGWVLKAAVFPMLEKGPAELVLGSTPRFMRNYEPNVVARNRLEYAAMWALAKKRAKSKKARAAASSKIQAAFRAFQLNKERTSAAVRIQRWVRWQLLRRSIRKARKRAARKKKKAAREAREAVERAKWTEAQLGVLVAIELAYGPPQNRSDWALRSTFVGGEGSDAEKALGESLGYPKALKDIQVKWEEMHASGELDELDLLSHLPPVVLDAILPPWHARKRRKSKKHRRKSSLPLLESSPAAIEVESLEVPDGKGRKARGSLVKQKPTIGFRGDIPPEFTSVAARFSNFQIS